MKDNEMIDGTTVADRHPAEHLAEVIVHIYNESMTTTSGGNLSVIDGNGDIWITPSAIDKGTLKPEDIIRAGADGSFSGKHKPSSEYPFHRAIYSIRPDIKAIVHAHPPALTAFSIVHRIPETAVLKKTWQVCGPVGYAEYELPGSEMLGEKIAAEFSKGFNSVIMENHAVVVGGTDLEDALARLETLELCAVTIRSAASLGSVVPPDISQYKKYDAAAGSRMEETDSTVCDAGCKAAVEELCNIVHRACRQGLMYGYSGTVTVRVPGNGFVITPGNKPLRNLAADDVVRVTGGKYEKGKTADRSLWLHHEIYNRFPSVNAVIMAQPPSLMAFAVTETDVDVRTIPESWIFLQDIPSVPFGNSIPGSSEIPDLLSGGAPSVMIRNDSFVVTGGSLLQAFDRLEVAELSAKSLVMAAQLGPVFPITDKQTEELRKAFFGS